VLSFVGAMSSQVHIVFNFALSLFISSLGMVYCGAVHLVSCASDVFGIWSPISKNRRAATEIGGGSDVFSNESAESKLAQT
jgi:hypothetical protein